MLVVSLGGLLLRRQIYSLPADELLQFPLPDEGFDLLFQVVAIDCVMTVVTVEAAIFVS